MWGRLAQEVRPLIAVRAEDGDDRDYEVAERSHPWSECLLSRTTRRPARSSSSITIRVASLSV